MSRPFLKPEEKKDKLGITISKELNAKLGIMTNNKSKFIENLISEYLKSITVNKEVLQIQFQKVK